MKKLHIFQDSRYYDVESARHLDYFSTSTSLQEISWNNMKYYETLIIVLIMVFSNVGCTPKKDDKMTELGFLSDLYEIVSPEELIKSPEKYSGKRICISAILAADRNWLAGNPPPCDIFEFGSS